MATSVSEISTSSSAKKSPEARAEDLDSLQETLAWLSDPNHAAEMAEAEDDVADGRMLSLKEVRAQLTKR